MTATGSFTRAGTGWVPFSSSSGSEAQVGHPFHPVDVGRPVPRKSGVNWPDFNKFEINGLGMQFPRPDFFVFTCQKFDNKFPGITYPL
jgi:hypothetical protein